MPDRYEMLGTPRRDACSKCGGGISDEHVPLMLFADGRNLMWIYCQLCEPGILRLYHKGRLHGEDEIKAG